MKNKIYCSYKKSACDRILKTSYEEVIKQAKKKERGEIIKDIISQPCNTPEQATAQKKVIELIVKRTKG